ncbi:MAG: N-acetylmuramoyl-L-alanine amidase [Eudoraea sp.]|nr:N-acetylmuramoyl-L-alanine amidase [Eudoraea sp.]
MRYIIASVCFLVLASCASRTIIDKPIVFDKQRKELTKEYLSEHYGIDNNTLAITPKMIVLHWTAIPTFEESFDAFKEPVITDQRKYVQNASNLNVSAHFLVDQDGAIYRLMPETWMARHVIGLNHCTIGIENVGGTEETPLTEAQVESNIWLVHYLSSKYEIDYLIGHHEYTLFEDHELWLEKDAGYRTEKTDPGEEFMTTIREATIKFNFKKIPQTLKNDEK